MRQHGWNYARAKELQDRDGRTTEWLARSCGVENVDVMRHYLSGRRKPKLPVIKLLAQVFNVSETELTGPPVAAPSRGRTSLAG